MQWNIYITNAQNVLQHNSALHEYHHQGVFTLVTVVFQLKFWYVCKCANVLDTTDHFENTTLTTDDGTHGVPKHVQGDFVHLSCLYSSAFTVGFIDWQNDSFCLLSLTKSVCIVFSSKFTDSQNQTNAENNI